MFVVEASTTLPHPPEAVLAAVGCVETTLHWQVGVVGVRRARHRPRGPLLLTYFALGVRHPLAARILVDEPGTRFVYEATGAAFALVTTLTAERIATGARLRYRLELITHALASDADGAPDPALTRDAATLRRLLVRRVPRDLARLESYVGRRVGGRPGRGELPPVGIVPFTEAPRPALPS